MGEWSPRTRQVWSLPTILRSILSMDKFLMPSNIPIFFWWAPFEASNYSDWFGCIARRFLGLTSIHKSVIQGRFFVRRRRYKWSSSLRPHSLHIPHYRAIDKYPSFSFPEISATAGVYIRLWTLPEAHHFPFRRENCSESFGIWSIERFVEMSNLVTIACATTKTISV